MLAGKKSTSTATAAHAAARRVGRKARPAAIASSSRPVRKINASRAGTHGGSICTMAPACRKCPDAVNTKSSAVPSAAAAGRFSGARAREFHARARPQGRVISSSIRIGVVMAVSGFELNTVQIIYGPI
jgi:hypothetical protein